MMEVKKWQRRTWWLARYFELAVPMAFMSYLGIGMALVAQRKLSLGLGIGLMLGLVYMATLRDVVEATWRRQALDWLMSIRHRLTQEEAAQLKTQAEEQELKLCRVWALILATVLMILAFSGAVVWAAMARVVLGVMVGTLICSHLLMARIYIGSEVKL